MTHKPIICSDDGQAIFMGGEDGLDGVIVRKTDVVATIRRGNLNNISELEGISLEEAARRYDEVLLKPDLVVCMDRNCTQTPIPTFLAGIRNGWAKQLGGAEFIQELEDYHRRVSRIDAEPIREFRPKDNGRRERGRD